MSSEPEAPWLVALIAKWQRKRGPAGAMGYDVLLARAGIALQRLHAEREADRAAMREALAALEHTVAWNDDEVSPAFVVDCRAAIEKLKARTA